MDPVGYDASSLCISALRKSEVLIPGPGFPATARAAPSAGAQHLLSEASHVVAALSLHLSSRLFSRQELEADALKRVSADRHQIAPWLRLRCCVHSRQLSRALTAWHPLLFCARHVKHKEEAARRRLEQEAEDKARSGSCELHDAEFRSSCCWEWETPCISKEMYNGMHVACL